MTGVKRKRTGGPLPPVHRLRDLPPETPVRFRSRSSDRRGHRIRITTTVREYLALVAGLLRRGIEPNHPGLMAQVKNDRTGKRTWWFATTK